MIIRKKTKSEKPPKFYHPSKFSLNNHNRFINQLVDRHTVGVDNNKRHSYRKTTINSYLATPANVRHKYYKGEKGEDISPILKMDDKVAHFNGKITIYYTNTPFAIEHRALVCLDIDPTATTTKQGLVAIAKWLEEMFPDCYWEFSSLRV